MDLLVFMLTRTILGYISPHAVRFQLLKSEEMATFVGNSGTDVQYYSSIA